MILIAPMSQTPKKYTTYFNFARCAYIWSTCKQNYTTCVFGKRLVNHDNIWQHAGFQQVQLHISNKKPRKTQSVRICGFCWWFFSDFYHGFYDHEATTCTMCGRFFQACVPSIKFKQIEVFPTWLCLGSGECPQKMPETCRFRNYTWTSRLEVRIKG